MEQLTALVIVVSVMAQAITLFVLHRSIQNQADRADIDHARRLEVDRNDRLRRAYGNLIKAADYIDRAFRDLMMHPTGHDRPGALIGEQLQPHNRYALVEDMGSRATELGLEAQAVILLDHPDDPALQIWRDKVLSIYTDFMIDCFSQGLQKDGMERLDKLVSATKEMQAAARVQFPAPDVKS